MSNVGRPLLKLTGQIKSNLVTAVEGSLTAWIGAMMIN